MPPHADEDIPYEGSEGHPLGFLLHEEASGSNDNFISMEADSQGSFEEYHDDDDLQGTHKTPLLPIRELSGTSLPRVTSPHEKRRAYGILSCVVSWIQGPPQPHKYKITPLLERWQTAPSRLIDTYLPSTKQKLFLLLTAIGIWGVVFLSVLHASVSNDSVVRLSCYSSLWPDTTVCGVDGDSCRPFDEKGFAFRCPAGCADTILLEPYAVGGQMVNYRGLVIGGGDSGIYRGDSRICAAGIHAGLISQRKGGCGFLRRTGEQSNYTSVQQNGITSIEFPSNFPSSYTFDEGEHGPLKGLKCSDTRWPLFTFSLIVTALLSICIASPAVFYASIFFIVYFQVALVSDAPYFPDYDEVVSIALGRFLPTAFVGFAMYYFCVSKTLTSMDAHWDKTVLWLGGLWVAALNTDTFDKIPLSRLTPHDIQQQPGALLSLIIIVSALILIAITQTVAFRNEGRLPTLLRIYGIMALGILALLAVPHMMLRLHHYILGLIFLPGTTLQTRPSLLYQGLCMGLFINGVARWDYDSILETPASLLEGAKMGTIIPDLAAPLMLSAQSLFFNFTGQIDSRADGISVLVNDVLRFQKFKPSGADAVAQVESFNWTRHRENEPEYFRFAYVKSNPLGGIKYYDFTDPAVWEADGEWRWNASVESTS